MTMPRKGVAYVSALPILLRDAQPTATELSDRALVRRRDLAWDELFRMYREAEKAGTLAELDFSVRTFCEDKKQSNGGKLPPRKGGRPKSQHDQLLVCRKVQRRIDSGEGILEAIRNVAEHDKPSPSYARVYEIWYNSSSEWQGIKRADLAEMALPTNGD
jgi:hypothetical protein